MHFPITSGVILQRKVGAVYAVDGLTFDVRRGETLGLVGESGCGKTTTGRAILQLDPADHRPRAVRGRRPRPTSRASACEQRKRMQMIFQDPYASLNSRMTIGDIVGEPLLVQRWAAGGAQGQGAASCWTVGIDPTRSTATRTSSAAASASASASRAPWPWSPNFIVCDEPISALDVSIRRR